MSLSYYVEFINENIYEHWGMGPYCERCRERENKGG